MPCQTSHFKTEKNEVQRHQVTVYNLTKKKKKKTMNVWKVSSYRDMARFPEMVPG